MARPPMPAAAPPPPPGAGAAPPGAGAAPDDTGADAGDAGGADDTGDQPEVWATIMTTPDDKFILVDGDEPEEGEEGNGEPDEMDQAGVNGPTLLKQIMAKLQEDKGGEGGAEASFGKGFRGEPDETAAGPPTPGM